MSGPINEKIQLILSNLNDLNSNKENFRSLVKLNVSKLKELKDSFGKKFTSLIDDLNELPKLEYQDEHEESPASIKTQVTWEWHYHDNSNKKFLFENDIYSLNSNMGYSSVFAYCSETVNSTQTFKVKFHDVTSFGCSGFGLMSKQDPLFQSGGYCNSGTHCMFCMCCNGPWSAKYMVLKGGEAMQYRLKSAQEKFITFEINMEDRMFRVYDPSDSLYSEYDINQMAYQNDLVLVYYTGSGVTQSFELVFL